MFRLTFTINPEDEDDLVAQFWEHNLTGISQYNRDDGQLDLIAWFATRNAAAPLAHLGGALTEIPDQNWNAIYQATWQPMAVGESWYLAPPNHPSETPANRHRLEMKPGLAFGNGDHATTHLCLEAMEQVLKPHHTCLDIGCGSGLLSEAAEHLGAQSFGCDLSPVDLPPNAFQGSLDALKTQCIDVGAMNIQAGILADLWPDFARVVRQYAILSGYQPEQSEQIEALIQPPWRIIGRKEKDGWRALVATTRSKDQDPPPSGSS